MEVKINKEIRNYTEAIFFGLSLRQLIFSLLAIACAVILFFSLRATLHIEVVSWICIAGAAPFAALGFIKFNGMTFEKFTWAVIKSEILMPTYLTFRSRNMYMEMTAPIIKKYKKELRKSL